MCTMCVCARACVLVCVCMYVCACMYVCVCACVCVCAHTCVHVCVCELVCVFLPIFLVAKNQYVVYRVVEDGHLCSVSTVYIGLGDYLCCLYQLVKGLPM